MSLNQTIVHVVRKQGGFYSSSHSGRVSCRIRPRFPRTYPDGCLKIFKDGVHNLPGQTTPLYLYRKKFLLCPDWYFSILTLLPCLLPSQCFQGHGFIFSVYWFLGFPKAIFPPDSTRPGPSASPFRVNNNLDDSGILSLKSCLYYSRGGPKLDAIF